MAAVEQQTLIRIQRVFHWLKPTVQHRGRVFPVSNSTTASWCSPGRYMHANPNGNGAQGQRRQLGALRGNMPRAGALSAPHCLSERLGSAGVEPSRTELLSRHGSWRRNPGPRGQAATGSDGPAARGDSADDPLVLRPAARLAGLADRPERQASLEFIQVEPAFFGEYRDVMRDYAALPPRSSSGRASSERSGRWRRRRCSIMTRG